MIQVLERYEFIQKITQSKIVESISSYDLTSGVVLFVSLTLAVYLIFTTLTTSLLITG